MSLILDPVREYLSRDYSTTGLPAKNLAQILRSFLLFAMLFNRTDAKLSLTSWVEEVLSKYPVLFTLIECPNVDFLPPFGSYFDFVNHFRIRPREQYARSALLPKGKNVNKRKKELGTDGKHVEAKPDKYATKNVGNPSSIE